MQYKFFLEPTKELTILDRIKERIKSGHLKQHYCKDLARGLINYLCGKQEKFAKPVQIDAPYFIQHILQEKLLDNACGDNLFLLQIGKDYHTLVLEKLLDEEETKFIIYQSWYSTFTLDWWLGNDRAPHQISEDQLVLRELYGRGKQLTINQIKEFILTLTQS